MTPLTAAPLLIRSSDLRTLFAFADLFSSPVSSTCLKILGAGATAFPRGFSLAGGL